MIKYDSVFGNLNLTVKGNSKATKSKAGCFCLAGFMLIVLFSGDIPISDVTV